jgi:hypothetical protein
MGVTWRDEGKYTGQARADVSHTFAAMAILIVCAICATVVFCAWPKGVEVHIIEYTTKGGETIEVKDPDTGKTKILRRVIHKLTEE